MTPSQTSAISGENGWNLLSSVSVRLADLKTVAKWETTLTTSSVAASQAPIDSGVRPSADKSILYTFPNKSSDEALQMSAASERLETIVSSNTSSLASRKHDFAASDAAWSNFLRSGFKTAINSCDLAVSSIVLMALPAFKIHATAA